MARYKLWDKQEDIYTLGRDPKTGKQHWTAQEYMENFAAWAMLPTAKPVVGGGLVNGMFFDDLSNLKASAEHRGASFDPGLTDEELLQAIEEFEDQQNNVIPEPSAGDVQASLAALTELQGLEDSELKHSTEDPITYTQLQARYANYYARGLWTKRYIALAVQKGRLTVEQFKDITGEVYDPDHQTAPMLMEEALNEMGVETNEN